MIELDYLGELIDLEYPDIFTDEFKEKFDVRCAKEKTPSPFANTFVSAIIAMQEKDNKENCANIYFSMPRDARLNSQTFVASIRSIMAHMFYNDDNETDAEENIKAYHEIFAKYIKQEEWERLIWKAEK